MVFLQLQSSHSCLSSTAASVSQDHPLSGHRSTRLFLARYLDRFVGLWNLSHADRKQHHSGRVIEQQQSLNRHGCTEKRFWLTNFKSRLQKQCFMYHYSAKGRRLLVQMRHHKRHASVVLHHHCCCDECISDALLMHVWPRTCCCDLTKSPNKNSKNSKIQIKPTATSERRHVWLFCAEIS